MRSHIINIILFNYCRNRPIEKCCKYTGIYLPSPNETSHEPQASASTHYENQQGSLDPERNDDSSDNEMDTYLASHEAQGTRHQSTSATNKTQPGFRTSSDKYLSESTSDDDLSDNTGNIMYSIVSKGVGLGELQSCLFSHNCGVILCTCTHDYISSPPPPPPPPTHTHTHTPGFKFRAYASGKWVLNSAAIDQVCTLF